MLPAACSSVTAVLSASDVQLSSLPPQLSTCTRYALAQGPQSSTVSVCSTNMAIQDAGALGKCLAGHKDDVQAALQQYQKQRLPATTQEVDVLCSHSQSTPLPFKAVPCAFESTHCPD